MSKVQQARPNAFTTIPTRDYLLVIEDVEQFEGPSGPYARVIVREPESGKRIYSNFTLGSESNLDEDGNPRGVWAIQELFDAINGCSTNQRVDLADHDFEKASDNRKLQGSVIIGRVYSEEFPVGSDRWRNKLGRVQAAQPKPAEVAA